MAPISIIDRVYIARTGSAPRLLTAERSAAVWLGLPRASWPMAKGLAADLRHWLRIDRLR